MAANIRNANQQPLESLLAEASIRLFESAESRDNAIRLVGSALLECDAVNQTYTAAMLAREKSVSTYVANGIAFPHATFASANAVKRDAIVVLRFPGGVDWHGNQVHVAIGIAARGRGHIALLSRLATVLLRPAASAGLREASSPSEVFALLKVEN